MSEQQPGQVDVQPEPVGVERQGTLGRVMRLLLAVVILLGAATQLLQPVLRPVDAVVADLRAGVVRSLTIETPDPTAVFDNGLTITWVTEASVGPFTALAGPMAWVQEHRPSTAFYTISSLDGSMGGSADGSVTDGSVPVRQAAAAAGVAVVDVPDGGGTGVPSGNFLGIGVLAVVATLAALVLLVAGPQPRLATRWAWFWLSGLYPLILLFVLLEPVPLWRSASSTAPARRLTAGWAFLVVLVLVALSLLGVPLLRSSTTAAVIGI